MTADDAVAITAPGMAQVVRWRSGKGLDQLRDEPVKLRFYLRDARLYGFRFA